MFIEGEWLSTDDLRESIAMRIFVAMLSSGAKVRPQDEGGLGANLAGTAFLLADSFLSVAKKERDKSRSSQPLTR